MQTSLELNAILEAPTGNYNSGEGVRELKAWRLTNVQQQSPHIQ